MPSFYINTRNLNNVILCTINLALVLYVSDGERRYENGNTTNNMCQIYYILLLFLDDLKDIFDYVNNPKP